MDGAPCCGRNASTCFVEQGACVAHEEADQDFLQGQDRRLSPRLHGLIEQVRLGIEGRGLVVQPVFALGVDFLKGGHVPDVEGEGVQFGLQAACARNSVGAGGQILV